jgi:hypothetical protein
MPSDLRAALEAAVDLSQRPKPRIAELSRVNKALTELCRKATTAIRAQGTALGRSGDLVVQEINRARENAESDLLDSYRRGKLALFLDIDGTDERLERITGTVDRTAIKGELASIEGKIGTIVGRPSDLDTFAHKFLADRGYSDFEAASINHEITAAVDQAPVIEASASPIERGGGEAAASVDHETTPADAPSVIPMPWKEALPRWLGKQKRETALNLGALPLAKAFFRQAKRLNVKLPSRPQRMVKTIEKSLRDMREAAGA